MRRDRVLYDSDVLIDVLRGHSDALAALKGESRPAFISALVVAELHSGVRDGPERRVLDDLTAQFAEARLESTDAVQGGLWRRDWGRSHGTGLIDALIAAQAERLGAELVTLNAKHVPMLGPDAIRVPYTKP